MSCISDEVANVLCRYAEMERNLYSDSFENCFSRKDSIKRTASLVREMDYPSRHIVYNCLRRIDILKNASGYIKTPLDDDEQKAFECAFNTVKNNVYRLGENIYEYNGYLLPTNDFRSEIFYDRLGVYTLKCANNLRYKSILDIGAYIGDSALILSELSQGTVYAFEPILQYYEMIKRTQELNQVDIVPVNMVVADDVGYTDLAIGDNLWNSTIKKVDSRIYTSVQNVPTTTIDEYVKENFLKVGLIKIHAEGAEQYIIHGAKLTIQNQKPTIIVEINHTESDFFDIKPIIEELNPGYHFSVYKPYNGFSCLGLKLIAEQI